ncbi:hypothetical protein KAU40_00470 [Candidatus Parcubacteria bacterium]|nr:hypothetical protein [Candidatus Parcubacteria bacterium]
MKGFTLIELLIIVGTLMVLIVVADTTISLFEQESDLNNSAEQIINVLRLAQNKTLTSEQDTQWGVYFETDKYVLFKGSDYNPLETDNEIHNLSKIVEISKIALEGLGSKIVFDRVIGSTNQFGEISLELKTDTSKTKSIYIENSGQIGLTEPSTPSNIARIKDSRHIHFDLGWSIQDAITLKFKFLGPEPDQIETIDMADYFDVSKTEFDWSNEDTPFVVNGFNQVFRIHTHFLDAFNTILCIHRDRNNNKNNEEVLIYIIDGGIEKDIVHYSADVDDTVEKGFYVFNTMETQ